MGKFNLTAIELDKEFRAVDPKAYENENNKAEYQIVKIPVWPGHIDDMATQRNALGYLASQFGAVNNGREVVKTRNSKIIDAPIATLQSFLVPTEKSEKFKEAAFTLLEAMHP